jgi:hypothetical protein
MSDILLSTELSYTTQLAEAKIIEARFEESAIITGSALAWWAITLIVVGGLGIIAGVVLIILKVRKNSFGNYKKNFKY